MAALLTACTGTDDRSPDPAAGASATPTSTAVPTTASTYPPTVTTEPTSKAQSAVDPGEPLDLDEATAWTDAVAGQMQGSVSAPLQGSSGHLDDTTSQNRADRVLGLPAGNYSYYFACRGGGEVTFAISSGVDVGDGTATDAAGTTASPVLSGPCTGQVQGGDFTAVDGGTEFRIGATGEPIDFVFRYGEPIAR